MNTFVIPVIVSILILGLIGLSQDVYANPPLHSGGHCDDPPVPDVDYSFCDLENVTFGTFGNPNGPDLSGADFTGAKFGTTSFIGTNLTGAIFTDITTIPLTLTGFFDSDLSGTDFSGLLISIFAFNSDFIGTDFTGANLSQSQFINSDLTGANFSFITITGLFGFPPGVIGSEIIFRGVDLTNVDFTGASLFRLEGFGGNTGARFSDVLSFTGADFTDADLRDQLLVNKDFTGAIFTGADLSGAAFRDVDFTDVNLSGVDLSDAEFTTGIIFTGADFSGANFNNVDLSAQDLSNVDFSGADFTDANLVGTILTNTNLSNVDFTGKDLSNADFSGAILSGTDFSDTILTGATLRIPTQISCGAGTTQVGDECVPVGGSHISCAPGTMLVDNVCEPDVTQSDLNLLQDIIDGLNTLILELEERISQLQEALLGPGNNEYSLEQCTKFQEIAEAQATKGKDPGPALRSQLVACELL